MKKFNIEKSKKIEPPYRVPENYFEQMSEGIQHKILTRKKEAFWVSSQLKLAFIPAMLLLIAVVIFWPGQPTNQQATMDQLLEEISKDDIEEYLSFTNVSEYELASVIESTAEVPESDSYLNGIDLEEDDMNEILLEFDILSESIDS